MPDTERRPLRVCDACGGIDDLPRHSHITGPDQPFPAEPAWLDAVIASEDMSPVEKRDAVAVLVDETWQMRHMACCAAAGCPDGSCTN